MFAIKTSHYNRSWLPAGSVLLLSLAIPLSAQSLFNSGAFTTTGAGPQSVVVGDFNGDGRPDLATANATSNDVTVLLGSGAGRFKAATGSPFRVGTKPQSVAAGDFNGDGRLDLAIANSGSDNLSVLLGDGAGGFTTAAGSPFPAGRSPVYVAVGDFNRDGKLDLAVANEDSNSVMVLLGSGTGFSAGAGSPFRVGTTPQSIAVGDFTGDGKLDLAVANAGSNSVTLLRGNGVGGFTAANQYSVGAHPTSLAAGDFNGDGKLDLVTANAWNNTVSVLFADGSGGLRSAGGPAVVVDVNPVFVAAGDFDGDGTLDLATANAADNTIGVLLGDGHGSFAAATGSPFAVGATPSGVAVGDFNGDGKPDLAAAIAGEASVAVLLNRTPTYSSAFREVGIPLGIAGVHPAYTAVGDFNNDGRPDVAIVSLATDNMVVMLGNGAGGFTQAPGSPFATGEAPHGLAVGDFNGDGNLDLVTSNYWDYTITLLLGNGTGRFTPAPGSPFAAGGYNPVWVAVGDFNGDGKLDVATANLGSSSSVLLGNGAGGLAQAPGSPFRGANIPQVVAAGDYNGDGKPDILSAGIGEVAVLLGNGAGSFESRATSMDYYTLAAASGDFNGDGKLDVAVTFFQSLTHTGSGVAVLLGDGAGGFKESTGSPYSVGPRPEAMALGDVDQDGKLDLVITDVDNGKITMLLGNGAGGFAPAPGSPFTVANYPRTVAVEDFNRDGKPDVAVGEEDSIRLLVNTQLRSIRVSPATASVAAGRTQQFTATGAYSDNSTQDLTASVAWSSSNNLIATISNAAGEQGTATGESGGLVTVTAALAGVSSTATVTVSGPTLQSITVTPGSASMLPATTQQFTATGRFSDNSTKDVTASAAWSSSNAGILTISNSAGTRGLATAVSPGGPVTITATARGAAVVSASATATVSAPPLPANLAWGVNAAGQIYRYLKGNWTLIPQSFNKLPTQVSVAADGTVWALDSGSNIYAWGGSSWQAVDSHLSQVSVGSANNVWGVSNGAISRWNGSYWTLIGGPSGNSMKEVSAAMDGTVWALDVQGNIYSYTGSDWQTMPGALAEVSAGSASNVWGVNSAGGIYQWDGSSWSAIPGPANRTPKQVSVGADGTVYLIDSLGNIYLRIGLAWQQISGQLVQISAG